MQMLQLLSECTSIIEQVTQVTSHPCFSDVYLIKISYGFYLNRTSLIGKQNRIFQTLIFHKSFLFFYNGSEIVLPLNLDTDKCLNNVMWKFY